MEHRGFQDSETILCDNVMVDIQHCAKSRECTTHSVGSNVNYRVQLIIVYQY